MKRVALILTGSLEFEALAESLGRIPEFKQADVRFEAVSSPKVLAGPFSGFTGSGRLPKNRALPKNWMAVLDDLVSAAGAEVLGSARGIRRKEKADLVLIIDDLEVFNATNEVWQRDPSQAQVVQRHMREAVERYISGFDQRFPLRSKELREGLQWKVSFHLINPMIEAWFFGAPSLLPGLGVPPQWRLLENCDPEEFETDDPAYLSDQGQDCTAFWALSEEQQRQKQNKIPWLGTLPRHLHPKYYLSWLRKSTGERCCSAYQETAEGAVALRSLSWNELLRQPENCHYAGALLADIADALQVAVPMLNGRSFMKAPTWHCGLSKRLSRGLQPVLRNL